MGQKTPAAHLPLLPSSGWVRTKGGGGGGGVREGGCLLSRAGWRKRVGGLEGGNHLVVGE